MSENLENKSQPQQNESSNEPKDCKIEVLQEKAQPMANEDTSTVNNRYAISGSIPTLSTPDNLKQIYGWAISNVGESVGTTDKFLETPLYHSIVFKTETADKSLTMIEGLQGTGKTRLIYELSQKVKGNLKIKWTRNWREELWQCNEKLASLYEDLLQKEFTNQAENLKAIVQSNRRIIDADACIKQKNYPFMEQTIGKARCKALKEQALNDFLAGIRVFLVDFPDYSRSNANAMNNDIAMIQEFYESLRAKERTHLIITAQKELIMNSDHFFWGKFQRYTINPLSVDQLIKGYELNNPNTEIFEHEALKYLAEVSNGNFRVFKKYIGLCIEANREKSLPIKES